MENELREKIKKFVEEKYYDRLVRSIEKGGKSLEIDYEDVNKFDPELADAVLDEPDAFFEEFESVLAELTLEFSEQEMKARVINVPETNHVTIKNIRSKHLGKLIVTEGLVRQASDVRPVSAIIVFTCPSCSMEMSVKQNTRSVKQPKRCINCGRKGKFDVKEKKMVDTQRVVLEEVPEMLEGGEQPKRISVFLQEDLVDPKIVKKTTPGSKVKLIGVLKEVPLFLRGGSKSTRFDLIIEGNNLETLEKEYGEMDITDEDMKQINKLSKHPRIYKKFIDSMAPTIWGYEKIKEAVALQLFAGVKRKRPDGTNARGDIHILLVGDPGVAKSQILKYVAASAPKARYVSGKGATGAGLTAAVVKDEFLRGWALEAGALVLSGGGVCCIDEIDKMNKDDRVAMHEAMEQQTISISKANIQATLRSESSVLAAANPRLGRFDPYSSIAEQIDLPPTLINRFDLIFVMKDIPNRENDEKIASYVLDTTRDPEKRQPDIEPDLMKKYIAYAKTKRPRLTSEAISEIKNFYVNLRNRGSSSGEKVRAIPISPRQLEGLIRLSEASAKVRLGKKVTKSDARRAIGLVTYYLKKVGVDPETGELDIDRIVTGITSSQRSRIITIREILADLEERFGENIPVQEIFTEAVERGLEEAKTEEIVDKMKREGEIFEPKHGFIRRMK